MTMFQEVGTYCLWAEETLGIMGYEDRAPCEQLASQILQRAPKGVEQGVWICDQTGRGCEARSVCHWCRHRAETLGAWLAE